MIATATRQPQPEPEAPALSLDAYLKANAKHLAAQTEALVRPLHVPGVDPLPDFSGLKRQPFEAQKHVIAACIRTLERQKSLILVGEMGTGKTLLSIAIMHLAAAGQGYRTLVMCPGTLLPKWEDEIKSTVPNAKVSLIRNWKDALALLDAPPAAGPEFWIVSRDRAKLGAKWKPAVFTRGRLAHKLQALCPACGQVPCDEKGRELDLSKLETNRGTCRAIDPHSGKRCNSPLWTTTNDLRRWPPAKIIKSQLPKGFFDYFVGDEIHEEATDFSAQSVAMAALASSAKRVIAMTGTLTNGKAESLRSILFRLCSKDVVAHGFDWDKPMPFVERYGRIETTIREKESFGADNRMSAGKVTKTRRCVPGIMPTLYGQMLIGNTVFLSLEQVADELPDLDEHVVSVPMDPELRANYDTVSEVLRQHVTAMLQRGDRRLLGAMLTTLLAYPDLPFDWDTVGYWDTPKQILLNGKRPERRFVPVIKPPDLPSNKLYAKERKLLEIVKAEKAAGRQCWVYVQYTDKHDVAARLEKVLTDAGFRASILRQKVKPEDRLDWIAEHAPNLDVCICHPKLVQTGVDLFDKGGSYNFPTLIFYEVGYIATDLRQASRRSWRIGQAKGCKVYYLYYGNSMAEKALALMGKKVLAAEAIEGKFSSEGLVALDDGGSMELELARSLAANIDEPATAIWKSGRVHSRAEPAKIEEPLVSLPIKRAKPKPPKQTEIDWSVFDEPKSTVDWDAVAAAFAERPQLKIVG